MPISETVSVNAGEAVDQVNALADAYERAATAAAEADAAFKGSAAGGSAAGPAKLAASMEEAASAISEAAARINESLGRISDAANPAAESIGRMGDSADSAAGPLDDVAAGAADAAEASTRLAASADEAGAALDRQAVAGGRAGKSSGEAAAASGGVWKGVKALMIGAGVAAAYGIDKAMKFQSQMLLLQTQAGVAPDKVKQMSQGVLEISTQTGQSLSDVGESAYHVASNMASMGSTVPNMLNAVKIAAEGATVGHANMVDVTNALTAAIASGIPGVKDYGQAMGALNATVGSGDMSMQDLAEAFGTGVVASVKGYGLSLKDVGAATAVFGDNNIRGAKAGTDLRMAVQSLAVPMSSAKTEMKALGLTQNTLAKDMQSGGLLKALDDLQTRFKEHGITAKNEGQVITDLFGKKAGVGLALLLEQMDRLQSKYPAITQGANNFSKAWAATQASPAQKWKEAVAGLQASATGLGIELLPAFSKAVGWADKLLADINASKGSARDLAVAFGGIAALFTAKKLVGGIESAFQTGETALRGIGKIGAVLRIPGLDKLSTLGSSTGAAGMQKAGDTVVSGAGAMQRAADTMVEAAGAMQRAADTMVGADVAGGKVPPVIPGGAGGAAAEEEAATAVEAGIGASFLSGLKANLPKILGRLGIGALTAYTGNQIADALPKSAQQGKAPVKVASDAVGGMLAGSEFGPPGMAIGAGLGLWWGLGQNTNLGRAPNQYSTGTQNVGGGNNVAFGKTGPTTSGPWAVRTETTLQTPPQAAPANALLHPLGQGWQAPQPVPVGPANALLHPADIKAKLTVDDSSVTSAAAKVKQAVNGISQSFTGMRPAKFPAPDLSQLEAAKGKAQQDANAVQQAMQSPLQKQVKAAAPNLAEFAAAAGPARADGANISAGLASGIEANKGAVVAAATDVASAAAAAMAHAVQSHSPSKVTEETGKNVDEGLALGITKHASKPKAAAMTMTASTVSSLVAGLQGGQSAIDAEMQALGKNTAKPQDIAAIASTIAKFQTQADDALKKGIISKSGDSGIVKWLKADQAKLDALANKRAVLEQEITDASQIAQAAISNASIMNAQGAAQAGPVTPASSSDLITGMQAQADQAKQFAQQVQKLKSMGLNATSLNQIVQSGAASGLPVAQGLTGGGKAAVTQVNQLESQITASAAKLGNEAAPVMYQAGVQAGQGLASGLKSQLGALESAMKQLADSMVNRLKSDLKIKSPSQVFAQITRAIPQGAAQGVDAESAVAEAAVSRMASRMANNAASGFTTRPRAHPGASYGGYGGSGFGGGTTVINNYNITVNAQGSIQAEKDLAATIKQHIVTGGSYNWQTGIRTPGRAA